MVICRNENLIKRAAEVALNNLTVMENEQRWGRQEGEEGETVQFLPCLHHLYPPLLSSPFLVCSSFIFFGATSPF